MTKEEKYELRYEIRKASVELHELQTKLYKLKLVRAAHAINRALGEIGDEAAEMLAADMAKEKRA